MLGTLYEFTITSNSFTNSEYPQQIITRPINSFQLYMMDNYTPAYGTSYTVSVRVLVQQNNGNSFWSSPSLGCVITTPSIPTTQVVSSQ